MHTPCLYTSCDGSCVISRKSYSVTSFQHVPVWQHCKGEFGTLLQTGTARHRINRWKWHYASTIWCRLRVVAQIAQTTTSCFYLLNVRPTISLDIWLLKGWLVGWLVVFYVPSTAKSLRDGAPIYCPLRRTSEWKFNCQNSHFWPVTPKFVNLEGPFVGYCSSALSKNAWFIRFLEASATPRSHF